MSNSLNRKLKRKEKKKANPTFSSDLEKSFIQKKEEAMSEEQRKELRYKKLEAIFQQLSDKTNRYLFYCPDIPFACTLVKTIYEQAALLKELGFNTRIIHEVKGYKPSWLTSDLKKDLPIDFLTERKKNGQMTKPSYPFTPTDTIIIPEGFWTVMTGFVEIKQIHKVVLAVGYGGIATAEPGANWSDLGFTDVICISERLKEDYSKLWPQLQYHVAPYTINQEEFKPLSTEQVYPSIALAARSREDAQAIINIFYNRYQFLDMFQFKVMKKMDTSTYADTLRHCCVQVLVDEKAGHPAPPLEAISAGIPTITVYGRGQDHLSEQEGVIWLDSNDNFQIAEALAHFCLNWLQNKTRFIENKDILKKYSKEEVKNSLLNTFNALQGQKIKLFAAIKTAVDQGKLSDSAMALDQSIAVEDPTMDTVIPVAEEANVESNLETAKDGDDANINS